ncbi:hypothetical protein CEXT_723411 [Caerostris extrusa]|uniref:Uncharacterized protein n=1 Tax=Caerostris extrusa TaxID=172846 RepID=A0AAV4UTV2_CAEEX|nr:hypothetical protein CEXT_723411 [Caerostris extrusa]
MFPNLKREKSRTFLLKIFRSDFLSCPIDLLNTECSLTGHSLRCSRSCSALRLIVSSKDSQHWSKELSLICTRSSTSQLISADSSVTEADHGSSFLLLKNTRPSYRLRRSCRSHNKQARRKDTEGI